MLQLEIVKQKIEAQFGNIGIRVIPRETRGDELGDMPLHTIEGDDFFTRDLYNSLDNDEADIAVHSLKDMSAEHFFGNNTFALVDRGDARDITIFGAQVTAKLERGEPLVIGTCSPRREQMAIGFLRKALPKLGPDISIESKSIRGNLDTRLRKLDTNEFDGIILATAGLNRLLNSPTDAPIIRQLLNDKRHMILPLIECVPAPCQGAIVAEAKNSNTKAARILNAINNPALMRTCALEKKTAQRHGIGCLQKFGVTTISYAGSEIVYAAGEDNRDVKFNEWTTLPVLDVTGKSIFSTADLMGNFFQYRYNHDFPEINEPFVYVANYKATEQIRVLEQLKYKNVWAAGTKTWLELAKKGIWVEGCADALGLESLDKVWNMPLVNIDRNHLAVVTSNEAAEIWRAKGWRAYSTYATQEKHSVDIEREIQLADIIFWTSFRQFLQYKSFTKEEVVHVCSNGESASQFIQAGIDPVIFPTIKAFQQWRQASIRSRSVA